MITSHPERRGGDARERLRAVLRRPDRAGVTALRCAYPLAAAVRLQVRQGGTFVNPGDG